MQELGQKGTASVKVGSRGKSGRGGYEEGSEGVERESAVTPQVAPSGSRTGSGAGAADSSARILPVHVSPEDHGESLFQVFEGHRQQEPRRPDRSLEPGAWSL